MTDDPKTTMFMVVETVITATPYGTEIPRYVPALIDRAGLADSTASAYGPHMHELAITQSVVDAVLERLPNRQIAVVTLEIGRVSGIEADALRFCFELVVCGTALEGAELEIVQPPGRAHCRSCDTEFEVSSCVLLCECGSADVRLDSGDQLAIRSVRMAA